jgi:uncharacterized glyoxalase superfamily protein PhnB
MPTPDALPLLVALLVVRDAPSAIDFYMRALGAREVVRYVGRANYCHDCKLAATLRSGGSRG